MNSRFVCVCVYQNFDVKTKNAEPNTWGISVRWTLTIKYTEMKKKNQLLISHLGTVLLFHSHLLVWGVVVFSPFFFL